jgi:hypothetical protein
MTEKPAARGRSPLHRNFTIRDVAILIAATAFGLALARFSMVHAEMWGGPTHQVLHALYLGTKLVSCVALAWTLAYCPLRIFRPRPRFRWAIRQPGTAACYAVLVALAMTVVLRFPHLVIDYIQSYFYPQLFVVYIFNDISLGGSVIAIWLFLLISGGWRSGGDWVERFGKALGAYWIASDLLAQFVLLLVNLV